MCTLRLCGHIIRWHKPIKIFNLLRHAAVSGIFAIALAGFAALSLAGETPQPRDISKTSPVDAVRLSALSPKSGEATVGLVPPASKRLQRTAGNIPLPAMALAVALGLRNVHGPVERTDKVP